MSLEANLILLLLVILARVTGIIQIATVKAIVIGWFIGYCLWLVIEGIIF